MGRVVTLYACTFIQRGGLSETIQTGLSCFRQVTYYEKCVINGLKKMELRGGLPLGI